MRIIRFLLEKEFRQIFRNKPIVTMILAVPVLQLIILPLAANYEIKNISVSIVDHDHSSWSRQMISSISGSGYFKIATHSSSFKEAFKGIEQDKADLVLEIPAGFERNLVRGETEKLFIAVNAINGVKANLGAAYLGSIIRNYNVNLRMQLYPQSGLPVSPIIEVASSNWYNPFMNYNLFMVPGILAILVTMIGGYLSALNIVKEKEMGTIEQINVTPIRKTHFIMGKLIPFWILGLVVFSLGLLVSWLVYHIVPVGSLGLLYTFIAIYLLAVLGFGLLISTYSDTQQQAMFVMFFFIMIFILMGGLFTSIDSMPTWARMVTRFNPVSYLIDVMRMVVLKGSGFAEVKYHLLIIFLFGVVLNGWAVLNYRKTN